MLPTPCLGKTSKKLGKQSFILSGILSPPAWLKCVDICFILQLQRNGFWQCKYSLVSYFLLESWVLAANPQASVSGYGEQRETALTGTEMHSDDGLT